MHRHEWQRVGYEHVEVVYEGGVHKRWDTWFYFECTLCQKPKVRRMKNAKWTKGDPT